MEKEHFLGDHINHISQIISLYNLCNASKCAFTDTLHMHMYWHTVACDLKNKCMHTYKVTDYTLDIMTYEKR